jgi:hypothetical protein
MKKWLVIWKTWFLGEIDAPWPIVVYENTCDYKSTKDTRIVSKDIVNAVYQSFNEDKVEKFESEHIDAIVLATVLEASTTEDAIKQINDKFNDAVIEICQDITDDEATQLLEQFSKE